MTLIDGSTFANSSIAMMAVVKEASVPPYSSGISMAISYEDVSRWDETCEALHHVRINL
jgi:hypothetical protein